jgi:hypothetical protein
MIQLSIHLSKISAFQLISQMRAGTGFVVNESALKESSLSEDIPNEGENRLTKSPDRRNPPG